MAKKRVSLEEEKALINQRWQSFLDRSQNQKIDSFECFSLMNTLNMVDIRLIENKRSDLLG